MKKKICITLVAALLISLMGVFSVSAAVKTPNKPSVSITSQTQSSHKVKASTKKVSGAKKYEFQFARYNSKGKYIGSAYKTVSGTSTTYTYSRMCGGFKQTAKVRVRAIKGNSKSSWSSYKSITLKGNRQPCG